jgi:tryptophanase
LPAQALAVALYREGGVRGVEIGSVMFGGDAPLELVRLAVPRRVYTNSHLQYVAEVLESIRDHRDRVRGLRIVEQAPLLRHFTCRFEELAFAVCG